MLSRFKIRLGICLLASLATLLRSQLLLQFPFLFRCVLLLTTLSTDSPCVLPAWLHSVGPSWYCKRNVSAAFKQTSMTNFPDGGRNV